MNQIKQLGDVYGFTEKLITERLWTEWSPANRTLDSSLTNTTDLNSLNTTNPKNIRFQGTLEPSNSTYFANLTDPS
jgi:hypothetical protein